MNFYQVKASCTNQTQSQHTVQSEVTNQQHIIIKNINFINQILKYKKLLVVWILLNLLREYFKCHMSSPDFGAYMQYCNLLSVCVYTVYEKWSLV